MSESFNWSDSGLDRSHFHALANLLSLRNDGQAEPTSLSSTDIEHAWEIEDDSDDDTHSIDTSAARQITQSGHSKLKQKFLDGLAEFAANRKGGEAVACTAMRERESNVVIWITRNEGFSEADIPTFEKLGTQLASLYRTKSDITLAEIWDDMISYQQSRIEQSYIPDLRGSFRSDEIIHRPYNVHRPGTVVVDQGLLSTLKTLLFNLDDHGAGVFDRYKSLVVAAYNVRQRSTLQHIHNSTSRTTSISRRLWIDICMLARLRVAFERFKEIALTLPSFEDVSIVLVPRPQTSAALLGPERSLTLKETFNLLHVEFSQATVKAALGQKCNLDKIKRDFGKRQNRRLQVHAEVQMLLHLHKSEQSTSDMVPYLGCSKLSCFLCHRFVRSYGQVETRGCHGRAFQAWTVPEVNGLRAGHAEKISKAIKIVQDDVEEVFKASIKNPVQLQKTSVAGGSSLLVTGSSEKDISTKQRHIERLKMKAERDRVAEMFQREAETPRVKAPGDYSLQWQESYDECSICERQTQRRCSICNQDHFCSEGCEAKRYGIHLFTCSKRPLTSADYLWESLLEDLMPQEEDVLEDFGFNNVLSDGDKHKLLGVYKRLWLTSKGECSAEILHEWPQSGKLEDNIKNFYYSIPEHARGEYFPWLMQNPHVLDRPLMKEEAVAQMVATYFDDAKTYLAPEDRHRTLHELEPEAKKHCYIILAQILHRNTPDPSQMTWYSFGYVTCCNGGQAWNNEESVLVDIYQLLLMRDDGSYFFKSHDHRRGSLPPVTFTQFWKAYEEGALIELMDSNGLKDMRLRLPYLEAFLSVPPSGPRPSVWTLKQFIEVNDPVEYPPALSIAVDYGFINCKTTEETHVLMEIYRRVLASADPLELHRACTSGRLYDFANLHYQMKEIWKPLMSNLYPLEQPGESDMVRQAESEVKSEVGQDSSGWFSFSKLWNVLGLSGN
ncbi:hypothetical protein DE146DRAFT_760518 [Phaeosphaeria sp. MPI-PUGE-AT-0046c]|nr:hypothetical protein DE146DRAFT_760518 [Phaeosphaeria sp. MPI-PUGE-AT-0046c]